jgi:predicted DCC family thiol-disulfide oxidoreductase YuxK
MNVPQEPVIVFDGVCCLCVSSVQFIIHHDKRGVFRFASAQSAAGRALCQCHGLDSERLDAVVLIGPDGVRVRSDAALAIAKELDGGWRCFGVVGRGIPRPIRDWLYMVLASNRHRWFGQRSDCLIPTEDIRRRFLE